MSLIGFKIINGSSILFINVHFPIANHEKYEEYIMCVGILKSILESHEEDQVKKDFNATLGSPRFNEICDMLHENNVMFRDTDILPDNTCTHVNNGSQTCSWLDHISMFDVLLLLKEVGCARLRESDIHHISPNTPAPQYQPIDRKKRKGK